MPDQLMDLDALVARLNCKKSWARTQLEARRWPFRMVGGSYRFSEDDYTEILEIVAVRPAGERRSASRPVEAPRPVSPGKRPLQPRARTRSVSQEVS